MKRAVIPRAVAEECHGHAVDFEQLEAVSGTGCLQYARPDDAARAHQADFRREQVHAAAAPMRTAGFTAVKLRDQLAGMQPLGQRVAVSPVGAENNVVRAKIGTHAHGDGFLADVSMTRAVYKPALVRTGQLLLGAANEEHAAAEGKK